MIDSFSEARVVISPSGELLLALPIYANQNGAILDEKDIGMVGLKLSVGFYEQFGYLVYHPSQPYSFYMKNLDLFEDLGELK